ncbi:DNA topoisomerase III [Alkaliphilus sp. MSJ-5]|uniref:DNA topoisomerase n=1 Tax=Alkaliphilus flagellatus TaxID=2841507 RepID=A0ABS6G6G4_9FIRM|nr:DNA topoisomerase III [Alkaliphilus flagellatus]MBU5677203.1 DNA topoisomerase III [Alkaliphilus flagellatus]
MKKLVIAEKPSVAKDIAKVLNCKDKKDGYIEGDNYIVTWAIGHLVVLCDPEEYDINYKKWAFNNLPIIPEKIKLKPNPKTYKQYQIVKTLIKGSQVDEIICATDAGREGELIFRYIYELVGCRKPFKRLWISSLTEEAIKEGFAKLRDGKAYDPLYYSAKCRSESDWLVGMNGSRVYSIKYNSLLPIGRVQTPTLKIIVDRDMEIDNFTPVDYWEVKADFKEYSGTWIDLETKESKVDTIEKAEYIKNKVVGKEGEVTDCQKKKVVKKPPLLYDLTELQRDANKRYGYTAQRTLDIAQALYEKRKVITYPRTDSRYLSKDLIPKLKNLIKKVGLEGYQKYTGNLEKLEKLPITSRIVNDSKVSDHHAIIPTEKRAILDKFSEEEKNIYDIIARRFLSVFYNDYEYFSITIITNVEEENFKSNEQQTINQGWRILYNEKEKGINTSLLANIQKGYTSLVKNADIEKKQTKPPDRYNEALLLGAMENAGKFIDDEELREQLKASGIGTPATRASIIERIINVGYIERQGKNLISTEKGRKLIQVASNELSSPELTGKWERALDKIAKDQLDSKKFMDGIVRFTTFIVEDVIRNKEEVIFERYNKGKNQKDFKSSSYNNTLGICPACKVGNVMEGPKNFYCSEYKQGCKFGLFKEDVLMKKFKKKMTKTIVSKLIENKVVIVKGMVSPQTNNKFDGKIRLKKSSNGYWGWEFATGE